MPKRKRKQGITDADSPDFSTCEHCGEAIGWDDYSYTHMSNGFATCGTVVGGGAPFTFADKTSKFFGLSNPEIIQDPDVKTNAEPVEWYEDVAA